MIGFPELRGATKDVGLWNRGNGGGTELAADLEAFLDEGLLGRVDFGKEVDAAGDLGSNAAAVLNDEGVLVHGGDASGPIDDAGKIEGVGGGDERPLL